MKRNVKNAGGPRLNNNFELFTIGLHSTGGGRSMDHFNFGPTEDRDNVVVVPAVTGKLKHSGDRKTVNIYQKPRALLDWMVNHFSYTGDWVLDLCSGSGTGLASALALGRNCVSVEIDARQASVLKGRVLHLDVNLAGDNSDDLLHGDDEEPIVLEKSVDGSAAGTSAEKDGAPKTDGGTSGGAAVEDSQTGNAKGQDGAPGTLTLTGPRVEDSIA